MVWIFVVMAIVVLALAAWAGTGRLGEMPEVVTDRPKGRVPAGPIDAAFLDAVQLPRASSGYHRAQVDAFLTRVASGEPLQPDDADFDVVGRGYDMQVVDELLDRLPLLGTYLDNDDFERPEVAVDAEAEPESAPVTEVDADTDDVPAERLAGTASESA